jgi:TrmH family RNA methyltransferase
MISKAKIKFIHQLEHKKQRVQQQLFVAEGPKVVGDLIKKSAPRLVVALDSWLSSKHFDSSVEVCSVTDDELRKVSFLQHPQDVVALFPIHDNEEILPNASKELILALDGVQDPGNLGTIIRIADWFGISHIVCSQTTADVYNPKVVQATMGSIARVTLHYTDLQTYIGSQKNDVPVYGTLLDGNNIYKDTLSQNGIIVMGNEGNGISPEIRRMVNHRILIPNYPEGRDTAESLNVAIATAITCAEFRRPK